ncbi:hypothetical protein G1H11_24840 [Phytoactinopolyspora alkaliphila]|uniref:Uncharacterized protein n=1 Tax=Phytoactinopolyspora alkaliphila TaxID=1783498 RepID=A0A6N9YUQ5_9ACTN|nr:hypothetical protein [Phytoactinopolyspora alkaliphila]NED98529.1 hypothetical protein [Phytoactinopolyspora alkaliphila]
MSNSIRHETMRTSYGRTVEVGRLRLPGVQTPVDRVILDVPRDNPEYDNLWLSLSPREARDLAERLTRHATEAESAG